MTPATDERTAPDTASGAVLFHPPPPRRDLAPTAAAVLARRRRHGAGYPEPMASLTIAQDPAADRVLSEDPFALLCGMLLDQQFPMERAFAGPAKVLERFGTLDPAAVAAADPEAFADLCATPPAVHRYGRSMAGRIQALAVVVRDEYAGDASALWRDAATGAELVGRVRALPGFGEQKAKIFTALLGKQLGVRRPAGSRRAAPTPRRARTARSPTSSTPTPSSGCATSRRRPRPPRSPGPEPTWPPRRPTSASSAPPAARCPPTTRHARALALTTWARGTENRRPVWTCPHCSREHLRSIEGKLDSSWW